MAALSFDLTGEDMEIMKKDMHFICKNVGTRMYGSAGEKKAAGYIEKGFREAGLSVEIQEFPVEKMEYSAVEFGKVKNGKVEKLDVLPLAQSGFTENPDGEILEVAYLENVSLAFKRKKEIEGKAVILYGGLGESLRDYSALVNSGAKALIMNDNRFPVPWVIADGMPYMWMKEKMLSVLIPRYFDVVDILREGISRVFVRVAGRKTSSVSQNVIGVVKGGGSGNIIVTAHHDSVMAGEGATDNATGVAILLEFARRFGGDGRRRRNIILVSCGSEEVLSYGSLNFARKYADTVKKAVFAVNFDSCSCLYGENKILVTGNGKLLSYVKEKTGKTGVWYNVERGVSPYSDHFPMNVLGVPSIWFRRANMAQGYFPFHSNLNRLEIIDFGVMQEVVEAAGSIISELSGDAPMPFPRLISQGERSQISRFHVNLFGGELK